MAVYNISMVKSGDQIYEELREGILTLHYKPGQLLSENAIAAMYEVSRSPIRGVFSRLASENLLEIRPQKGSYVSLIDYEYIREIIFMRTMIEKEIIAQASRSMTADLILKFENNLKKQAELVSKGMAADLPAYYDLDSEFHEICFKHIGRERLWNILQESQVHYKRFRMLDIVSQDILSNLLAEHSKLFENMKAGKLPAAMMQLESHLSEGFKRIETQVLRIHPEYFFNI